MQNDTLRAFICFYPILKMEYACNIIGTAIYSHTIIYWGFQTNLLWFMYVCLRIFNYANFTFTQFYLLVNKYGTI